MPSVLGPELGRTLLRVLMRQRWLSPKVRPRGSAQCGTPGLGEWEGEKVEWAPGARCQEPYADA